MQASARSTQDRRKLCSISGGDHISAERCLTSPTPFTIKFSFLHPQVVIQRILGPVSEVVCIESIRPAK